jgi:hypothetical protein
MHAGVYVPYHVMVASGLNWEGDEYQLMLHDSARSRNFFGFFCELANSLIKSRSYNEDQT